MSATPVLEPRERFLRDITERIPADRIAEIHLFPPLRSGGRESGVAVIAAMAVYAPEGGPPPGDSSAKELNPSGDASAEGAAGAPPGDEVMSESTDRVARSSASASDPSPDDPGPPPDLQSTPPASGPSHQSPAGDIDPSRPPRLVIYRAVYRWTRKGPDRGRWEIDVTVEADAPLHAVSDVVRGVQRRAGDEGEPELITAHALRVALSDRPWAAAM
jgi:hypothetical protein